MKWKNHTIAIPSCRQFATPWHRKFAWLPVQTPGWTYWLCPVEYRFTWAHMADGQTINHWEYRLAR